MDPQEVIDLLRGFAYTAGEGGWGQRRSKRFLDALRCVESLVEQLQKASETALTNSPRRSPTMTLEVFSVWSFIEEEMRERGWNKAKLVEEMGGDFDKDYLALEFLEHVPYKQGLLVGDVVASKLSRAFGTSKQLWLNLDAAVQSALASGWKPPEDSP